MYKYIIWKCYCIINVMMWLYMLDFCVMKNYNIIINIVLVIMLVLICMYEKKNGLFYKNL